MYCTKCGLQALPADRFCAGCGASLTRDKIETGKTTPTSAEKEIKIPGQITQTPVKISVRPESTTNAIKIGPKGVKGWLLFLVLALMILWPLLRISNIDQNFRDAETKYPNLISIDKWGYYKTSVWASTFLFIAFSFYAGYGLAGGNNWKVVRRAIDILLIIGPLATLIIGALIPLIIFGNIQEMLNEIIGSFVASLLWTFIWILYLVKSKRVRNTYALA